MNAWYPDYQAPKPVTGGIKAHTRQGDFGATWWGQHWLSALSDVYVGGRLERGKNYARKGQVLSIQFTTDFSDAGDRSSIHALVQGSEAEPYEVSIALIPFAQKAWHAVLGHLCQSPLLMAKLLTGHLPETIETVLAQSHLSLLPKSQKDVKVRCTCPDGTVPCKHIAAVYYLVAEAIDQDPFVLFHLRGMPRDVLLRQLETYMGGSATSGGAESTDTQPTPLEVLSSSPPFSEADLLAHPDWFWQGQTPLPESLVTRFERPTVHAAIPKRLGPFPFWRGEQPFLETLDHWYAHISKVAAARLAE